MKNAPLWNRSLVRLAGAALGLSVAGAAHAAPPEFLTGLAAHPDQPNLLALYYDTDLGGLLYSADGGKSFRVHAGYGFTNYGLREGSTRVSMLGDGRLLVASGGDGLFAQGSSPCLTKDALVMEGSATAIAPHPGDPSVAFFLGQRTVEPAHRGLFMRAADGAVSTLGPQDGEDLYPSDLLAVARAESEQGVRLLEVGTTTDQQAFFRYSDDVGKSWTRHTIAREGAGLSRLRLLAAKEGPATTVVLSIVKRTGITELLDEVLISRDDGANFENYLDSVWVTGQSLVAPDGRLFLTDQGGSQEHPGGLWMAAEVGAPLEQLAAFGVNCVGWDPEDEDLYLCKRYELGKFDLTSKSYCRMYQLNETVDVVCKEPADLFANAADQLCDYWCGAAHYASSPFCSLWSCSVASRKYDSDEGWIEPPGTEEPRCAGFEPGTGPVGDGGLPGSDGGTIDPGTVDAGPGGDDASTAADGGATSKRKESGCSVGASGRDTSLSALGLLGLLAVLALRRRRAAV